MNKINLLLLIGAVLAAACGNNKNDKALEFSNDLENVRGWSGNELNSFTVVKSKAHSGEYVSKTDSAYRYGFMFRTNLAAVSDKRMKSLKTAVWANCTAVGTEALLVISIDSVGKSIMWQGIKLSDTVKKTDEWTEVIATADISKLKPHKDYVLSIYVWNNGNSAVYTDDHRVRFEE